MTLEKERVSNEMETIVLRMMDEGGIENVRARAVASEVGVSVGTIYNFYGSLDKLIERVCLGILRQFASYCGTRIEGGNEDFRKRILSEVSYEEPAAQEMMIRFLHLADIYMNYIREHEMRWNAMLTFNRSRSLEQVSVNYQREQDELFGFIGRVLSDTRLGKDADVQYRTARALWSGMHGIVLLNYLGQASEETWNNTWLQVLLLVRYFVRGLFNDQISDS